MRRAVGRSKELCKRSLIVGTHSSKFNQCYPHRKSRPGMLILERP